MIYNDQALLFEERFEKDNSFTVYNFTIQSLAIKMLSVRNHATLIIIDALFTRSHHRYNLC